MRFRGIPIAPLFDPQWAERRLEREMDDGNRIHAAIECRLCACTDESACLGGCSWVEADLCSSCDDFIKVFPVLALADGYGIAARAADLRRRVLEDVRQFDADPERNLPWPEWKAQLEAVAQRYGAFDAYGPRGPIGECGEDAWRSSWESKSTPEEAFLEDLSYWD